MTPPPCETSLNNFAKIGTKDKKLAVPRIKNTTFTIYSDSDHAVTMPETARLIKLKAL